jgi:ABC-type multidrug transport system fused ATPase/permease subunit
MRSYIYMILAVLFAFLLSLNTIKVFSLEEVSLFLTVIGLIYGLISAFTINNAWERFSKIRDSIAIETNSLMSMYIFSRELSDKKSSENLKKTLIEYCEDVPTIEWHNYWKSEKTHEKFRSLLKIVAKIKLKDQKDVELFDEVGEELRTAASARNEQLVLAQTRTSKIQWILNIFLSFILIIGLIFMSSANTILSIFIVTAMTASIFMIFVVLYELDSLKISEDEVSNEPYREIVRIIRSD